MTTTQPDSPTAAQPRASSQGLWLISPFYDLTFIIFSSVLLIVPHLAAGVARCGTISSTLEKMMKVKS